MNPRPKVRDYMATDLIVLRPEDEIIHAMKLLLDKGVSGAPVIDAGGKLVGMLSKKDCLRTALNAAYFQQWGSPVSGFMTTKVETIDAGMDLVAAAEWFLGSHFRRFLVLQDDQLVGQISRADVLRALVENWR